MTHTSRRAAPRTSRERGRGQALAEFALVAPIFFLVLFAIIDFGRYIYYVQVLNNAAREGTRYAIVHGSNSTDPSGPAAPGTTSADPTGANVQARVRNFSVGVIGNTSVLQIFPQWLSLGLSGCTEPVDPTDYTTNTGTDGSRSNCARVHVIYAFNSVIPIVPIPPITVTGDSTLVINN